MRDVSSSLYFSCPSPLPIYKRPLLLILPSHSPRPQHTNILSHLSVAIATAIGMSKATAEFDFFAIAELKNRNNPSSSSFQGIQDAVSGINPILLRNLIAGSCSVGPMLPPLPNFNANYRMVVESPPATAPLTIFYNGTVTVVDVNQNKADEIIKVAEEGSGSEPKEKMVNPRRGGQPGSGPKELMANPRRGGQFGSELIELMVNPGRDLPLARKQSLQRFIQKRKERLTSFEPYDRSVRNWEGEESGGGIRFHGYRI